MKTNLLFEQDSAKSGNSAFTGNMPFIKRCPFENDLIKDLNLHEIFNAMSQGNPFLYKTVKEVMLNVLTDLPTIIYRQDILKDCLNRKNIIREFFNTASSALTEGAYYKEYTQTSFSKIVPLSVRLYYSVCLLELLVRKLENLKSSIQGAKHTFKSIGMTEFCSRFDELLTREFFVKVKEYISDLKSLNEGGHVVIGSCIGNGLKGDCNVLRKISRDVDADKKAARRLSQKITTLNVIPLDNSNIENNAKEIEDAALVHILRAINQFTSSIVRFFEELRFEAGFYTGCVNLHDALSSIGAHVTFPIPTDTCNSTLIFDALYDAGMAVENRKTPVTNSLKAPGITLFIITGANQGGKSTYLRSIGLSQLMMQCGMFVPAEYYNSNVCDCLFTHFTREEDTEMNSGKLDEELSRINDIVGNITPRSLLLMNEPFATTTERDGSGIAADIVSAFYESGIKLFFVTHLYEFSNKFYSMELDKAMLLKAERNDDGTRSFGIREGKPLQTSFGEDLFREIADIIAKPSY